MSNTKAPISIFTGQRAQVRMVSRSWGIGAPALVDGVDWTPGLSKQDVLAFGSLTPIINYTTFDSITGKLSYLQSNQAIIEAMMMDYDQSQDEVIVNPALLAPFTVFANLQGLDGLIKGSYLLRGCKATGNPFTSTIKEGAKRSLDFMALNAYFAHGLAVQYTRLRGSKVQQAPPAQPTVTSTATGGFLGIDTYYVQITAVTSAGETTVSQETSIAVTSATTNKLTVTTPTIVSPVTAYNIYVSNRSNGELYSAQVTSGTSTDITILPSAQAARPPQFNTSGPPSLAGDVVMTATGNEWSGTLPKAAFRSPQTGLPYITVLKNGAEIASVDNPASIDTIQFSADGLTFSALDSTGDYDVYDVFTFYKP